MFTKCGDVETTQVLDKAQILARAVFQNLGTEEASEKEVRKAASLMGIDFEEIRTALFAGDSGMRRMA